MISITFKGRQRALAAFGFKFLKKIEQDNPGHHHDVEIISCLKYNYLKK